MTKYISKVGMYNSWSVPVLYVIENQLQKISVVNKKCVLTNDFGKFTIIFRLFAQSVWCVCPPFSGSSP
jgi:hypothetical protein